MFAAILAEGLIPDDARILDLGCGQGLLAAWLLAARECDWIGTWCDALPRPPQYFSFHGIERMSKDASRANCALGEFATIEVGDIRTRSFPQADAIVILDVLHYMDRASQESVLARARLALSARGVLLVRIGDASAGRALRLSNWLDQTILFFRGHRWTRLHCRSAADWIKLLVGLQLRVQAIPMNGAAPFFNVLLVANPR
ncbi:MAG: class I SAM-dependent methyltransferase [Steroidobacteraceae bacterium]